MKNFLLVEFIRIILTLHTFTCVMYKPAGGKLAIFCAIALTKDVED